MGEGISEGIEEEPQKNNNPMTHLNDLEDQPVGNDIEEEEHTMEEEHPITYTTTTSGQVSKPRACLIQEIGEVALILLLVSFWKKMNLAALVWGIQCGINNPNELKVLGFDEAMASPDKDNWQASVDCEHEWILKNGVWEVVDHCNIP